MSIHRLGPVVVGVLSFAALPASAALITQSVTFEKSFAQGHATFAVEEDFLLELFDPSLGALQSVSVSFATRLSSQSMIVNGACDDTGAPGCTITNDRFTSSQDLFALELPGPHFEFINGTGYQSPHVACTGTLLCTAVGELPDVNRGYGLSFDTAADLAPFTGLGAFNLNYRVNGTSCAGAVIGGGGQILSETCLYFGTLRMTGSIAYEYLASAPPAAVPEPASSILLCAGLGFLALARRRRGR